MRVPRLAWILAVLCLLLGALAAAPFLLTTPLTRFALGRAFPTADVRVGGAALSPSGRFVLRDLALDEPAAAPRPLLAAREVSIAFDWRELASRRVRDVRVESLILYARSSEPSRLPLLDLFSSPDEPKTVGVPLWIDTLNVQGTLRNEAGGGPGLPSGDWPLTLQMTMLGDRSSPSRRFELMIGGAGRSKSIPDTAFTLQMEAATRPETWGTRVVVRKLAAREAGLAVEADALRRYVAKLPADLHGRIDATLRAVDLSGVFESKTGGALTFDGSIRLRDLSVRSTAAGEHAFAMDRLTVAGSVQSPIDRWAPAALKLSDGMMRLSSLTYGDNAVKDFEASWRVQGQTVVADHFAGRIFDGLVSGSPAWSFATNAITRCDLQIKGVDVHQALANLSPENLDAEGHVSGTLHVLTGLEGQLAGHLDLTFDGPGTLSIGEIEEIKQMLVGNFGLDLANLAMRDLRRYPFQSGRLSLESVGANSELKLKFVRQPRTDADTVPPRKEIINGQEVWVGSLVVPTIDMTIPITGKSRAEILAMVSGFRPLIEAVSEQAGK
jgi:dicarboxylate transporter DctA-like protein